MLKLKAVVSQRALAVIDCKAFLDISAVCFFSHRGKGHCGGGYSRGNENTAGNEWGVFY